jgi:hypothetical protein
VSIAPKVVRNDDIVQSSRLRLIAGSSDKPIIQHNITSEAAYVMANISSFDASVPQYEVDRLFRKLKRHKTAANPNSANSRRRL